MGEILRGVLQQAAISRRPRWYWASIPWAVYAVDQELSGQIQIQANTCFLWTSFGFAHFGGIESVDGPANNADRGNFALIRFTDQKNSSRFSNDRVLAANVQSSQFGAAELDEYPLFPGSFQLGWSVWPTVVNPLYPADAYELVFAGIEYKFPQPLSSYGIEGGA